MYQEAEFQSWSYAASWAHPQAEVLLSQACPSAPATESPGLGKTQMSMRLGLCRWPSGKESTCQCRRCKRLEFDHWVGRSPRRGNGNPFHILAWRIPGQITLADYSPRGCKESDTTEETEHSTDRSKGRESLTLCPLPFAQPSALPGGSTGGRDATPEEGPLGFHHTTCPARCLPWAPCSPGQALCFPLAYTSPACRTRLRFSTTIQHLRKGELQ